MGECSFDGPAETAGAVFVNGFGEEKDGADFEDRGADEGGYTASIELFVVEFGVWADEGQPDEKGVYAPDYASDGEDYGYVVGDIPDRELSDHTE